MKYHVIDNYLSQGTRIGNPRTLDDAYELACRIAGQELHISEKSPGVFECYGVFSGLVECELRRACGEL